MLDIWRKEKGFAFVYGKRFAGYRNVGNAVAYKLQKVILARFAERITGCTYAESEFVDINIRADFIGIIKYPKRQFSYRNHMRSIT